MPIYADRETQQTIIYSRSGGIILLFIFFLNFHPLSHLLVYLLPPMENRRGRLFSIAALLAYGYASFTDNRASRSRYFNIGQYARTGNSS